MRSVTKGLWKPIVLGEDRSGYRNGLHKTGIGKPDEGQEIKEVIADGGTQI